jgi:hypothetical protein
MEDATRPAEAHAALIRDGLGIRPDLPSYAQVVDY